MKKEANDITEQYGKLSEMDRAFDIQFWQKQGSNAIFSAAWELVVEYYRHRRLNASELRLQRSVEMFGKI